MSGDWSGRPCQSADFTELALELLPGIPTIQTTKELAEIGAHEHEPRIFRVGCNAPRRAVEFSGELRIHPCSPRIRATQELSSGPGRAITVSQEEDFAIPTRDDRPRILPGRVKWDELPRTTIVCADMHALVGRSKQRAVVILNYSETVHIL